MKAKQRYTAAFQGEPGAFSHSAALKLLGKAVEPVPCASFKGVFEALRKNRATHAVIPIENTLHGSVLENYDHLMEFGFPIRGETSVRISHHLIAMPGTRASEIRRAFSHPVALNQCRRFFAEHPRIEPTSFYDTAGSVKMLANERPPGAAAVASEAAAAIYGGRILRRNLEDNRKNYTRFFLLTKQKKPPQSATGAWKTSVAFGASNQPGALFKAMACFALRDLNLTKIESRPLPGKPWEYLFYVDFAGSTDDKPVQRALQDLAETTPLFRVLGSYRPTP
ncbi:MAG TPA: prephenate dehydratase [Bryobacteraceae bacterium]|jgi:prephenate dehydratase